MSARPIIAVVPFGARGTPGAPGAGSRPGAWARQIARRLVERARDDETLELRPVFLVAMAEETSGEGQLIFGSTPAPELAAQYGASLGASHVLTGTYAEDDQGRRLDAALVDVATGVATARRTFPVPPGSLQRLEGELGEWVAVAAGARQARESAPAFAGEEAYAALLEGLEDEVSATLGVNGLTTWDRSPEVLPTKLASPP